MNDEQEASATERELERLVESVPDLRDLDLRIDWVYGYRRVTTLLGPVSWVDVDH